MISIGSAVAAIAQFAQFPVTGPTSWQIAGIGASVVVAVGGVFVWLTEENAPAELTVAHKAVEEARDALIGYEEFYAVAEENDRLVYLVQSIYLMRSVIELAASAHLSDEKHAELILAACDRSLPIAMGFQQVDQWTLGIYKAVPLDCGRRELVCVATKRAIECAASDARRWKEGTGIAGVSFSVRDEVVIPDLQAEGVSTVFGSASNETRNYDVERYRSMVAVPITVGQNQEPWGVVAATNDRVGHFSVAQANGLANHEGARALANMVALAVALSQNRLNQSAREGFPTTE